MLGGFILLFVGAGIFDIAGGAPLTPLQILWINFAIDVLLAIGLGFDAAAPGLMRRGPRDAAAPIVDRALAIRLASAALVMAALALGIVAWGEDRYDLVVATTMGLTTLSLMHIAAALECREPTGTIFSRYTIANRRFVQLIGAALVLTFLVTELSPLQRIFDTVSLTSSQWGICLLGPLAYPRAQRSSASSTTGARARAAAPALSARGRYAEAAPAYRRSRAATQRLAILLAMAMFVLVVDTSLMNVSISAVVHDLDTTASGVQSAIALEALVSAAFILIGSKIGDLIGRKRAYILGLLGYAAGRAVDDAVADPAPDRHLLGDHRRARRVAAAAGDAVADPRQLHGRDAAAGLRAGRCGGGDRRRGRAARRRLHHDLPLLAGRVLRRGRDHRDRARGQQARPRRALHRRRGASTSSARSSRPSAWAASCSGSSSGRRAARRSALLIAVGLVALGSLAWWLVRRKREGKPALLDVGLFASKYFRLGITVADAAADRARRADDRAADLPADGARVQRDGGGAVDRAALAEHVRRRAARGQAGRPAQPEQDHPRGLPAARGRRRRPDPDRAARRLRLADGRAAPDRGRRASACWSRSSTTTRSPRSRRSA